ncbi:MAG: RNA polymerase sporulation sigma factor SigK [Bacilli bacterium]|nr:RNA polymerase sporulation sigma factor SigK [Bacilli bacterium]
MFLFDLIKGLFPFTGSYSIDAFLDPLSPEEEKYYIERKDESKDARNKLIEHNLRLVAHIVKKYDRNGIDNDDLISIGTIGLIKGIDTYKSGHNVKITTYCARCIENEILMYFRKNNKYSNDISINDPIGYDKDGNPIEILDVLKVDNKDFSEEAHLKENISLLKEYLDVLTPRERKIINERYGLDNKESLTQKNISKKMGISRSYVSRIEKRALTKLLREFIKNNQYDAKK